MVHFHYWIWSLGRSLGKFFFYIFSRYFMFITSKTQEIVAFEKNYDLNEFF